MHCIKGEKLELDNNNNNNRVKLRRTRAPLQFVKIACTPKNESHPLPNSAAKIGNRRNVFCIKEVV
jgi:hypothetical protein